MRFCCVGLDAVRRYLGHPPTLSGWLKTVREARALKLGLWMAPRRNGRRRWVEWTVDKRKWREFRRHQAIARKLGGTAGLAYLLKRRYRPGLSQQFADRFPVSLFMRKRGKPIRVGKIIFRVTRSLRKAATPKQAAFVDVGRRSYLRRDPRPRRP